MIQLCNSMMQMLYIFRFKRAVGIVGLIDRFNCYMGAESILDETVNVRAIVVIFMGAESRAEVMVLC